MQLDLLEDILEQHRVALCDVLTDRSTLYIMRNTLDLTPDDQYRIILSSLLHTAVYIARLGGTSLDHILEAITQISKKNE